MDPKQLITVFLRENSTKLLLLSLKALSKTCEIVHLKYYNSKYMTDVSKRIKIIMYFKIKL